MTPYINPAFRDRQSLPSDGNPVALLTGAVEDPEPVYRGPGMSPAFRARGQAFLEAQAREVTPTPPRTRRGGRHAAYCVSLAFPVCFAVWSVVIGDFRLAMILLLMTLFMALVGLLTLDGPV